MYVTRCERCVVSAVWCSVEVCNESGVVWWVWCGEYGECGVRGVLCECSGEC